MSDQHLFTLTPDSIVEGVDGIDQQAPGVFSITKPGTVVVKGGAFAVAVHPESLVIQGDKQSKVATAGGAIKRFIPEDRVSDAGPKGCASTKPFLYESEHRM